MGENPFLENEEEKEDKEIDSGYCEVRKPYSKEELTEAQKKRNFKGLELMKEAIKKARPFRVKK